MVLFYLIAICLTTVSPTSNLFLKAETSYSASELCDKARELYSGNKIEDASRIATDAMNTAVAISDTVGLIKAYCLLAQIAIDKGDDINAVDYYNRSADLSPFCEPMFMLSSSLYNIASIYFHNGENEKALEYITKSILIDSRRESDSILALRYLLAAEILLRLRDYDKTMEMVAQGLEHTRMRKNSNVEARFLLVRAKCIEERGSETNPDWKLIEQEYRIALETLNTKQKGYYYGTNPYAPEFLYRLGLAVSAQGKDAKDYFIEAIEISRTTKKMLGVNPFVEIDCCNALAKILTEEGNTAEAQIYLDRVQALSYVPYIRDMGNKLSLSQMEFIRREKEMEIERQKDRMRYLLIISLVLILAIVCLAIFYRNQVRQRKEIEQKNAQLVKLGLQKGKLVSILKENPSSESDNKTIDEIVNDSVPFPDIKLSKREKEVLMYCCNGLISKEIASKMGVSVRTVESHKLNIFHKLGVNTTTELVAFGFKSGLIK